MFWLNQLIRGIIKGVVRGIDPPRAIIHYTVAQLLGVFGVQFTGAPYYQVAPLTLYYKQNKINILITII